MEPTDELIAELQQRVRRHPADRYPVQHALGQFHLGTALADAGRADEAIEALHVAARLLHGRLPAEEARALNALGAALRLTGRVNEAIDAFTRAAAGFESPELLAERGAAVFNLGLALRERPDESGLEPATDCFSRAEELLREAGQLRYAGAAARERGTALLASGRHEAATPALTDAIALAESTGDREGAGAALNVLGLVHLSAGCPLEAIESFRNAAASHPRSVRPQGYAMAKANLALAYEGAGMERRARLAARQALAAPGLLTPVAEQAAGVLDRLGDPAGDLVALLGEEPAEGWPGLVREEVVRWAYVDPAERHREAGAWIAAQLRGERDGTALGEAWLGALLELPPADMEELIRATLEELRALDGPAQDRFRGQISSAMGRFHVPQWMRLKDTFNRLADELGFEAGYG